MLGRGEQEMSDDWEAQEREEKRSEARSRVARTSIQAIPRMRGWAEDAGVFRFAFPLILK